MLRELFDARLSVDKPLTGLLRMRCRVTDTPDAGKLRDVLEQHGKIRDLAVRHPSPVGVDVLAEQGHLSYALIGEVRDLCEHVLERTGHFLAACIGHHAEAAILATALHDRDERGRTVDTRRG